MTSKEFYENITKNITDDDLQVILYNFLQKHTLDDLSSVLQGVFEDVITDAINRHYDAPKISTKTE